MASLSPFGQYLAGDSLPYRIDTRIKLLLLACFLIAIFLVDSWLGLSAYLGLLLLAYLAARIPFRLLVKGLLPISVMVAFVLLANTLGFQALDTPNSAAQALPLLPGWAADPADASRVSGFIPLIGSFGIKPYGFLKGGFLALRMMVLFSATMYLTYTSTLVELSDALVALLRPLAAWKVPAEDIAMVLTIALRFMPLVASEAEQVTLAQQARGAVFNKGGPLRRARAWLPVLVPLFVKLFRRADRIAAAMEGRCYRGRGRTHLRNRQLSARQLAAGSAAAAALVLAGVLL